MAALALLITFLCLSSQAFAAVANITAQDAQTIIAKNSGNPDFVILDIRTPPEFSQGHIAGAVSIDYYDPQFKAKLAQLDKTKTYLLYCRSGNRSEKALKILEDLGFTNIYHLQHGILEWQAKGLKLEPAQ